MAIKRLIYFVLRALSRAPIYTVAAVFGLCFYVGSLAGILVACICTALCLCFATGVFCVYPAEKPLAICVLCALVLGLYAAYSYRKNTAPLFTLVPQKLITSLSGSVSGNPVKTAGDFYRVPLQVRSATGSFFTASARGKVQLLVPSSIIESVYPGKLYSVSALKTKEISLIERGIRLSCTVKPLENVPFFAVQSINDLDWGTKTGLLFSRARLRLQLKRLLYSWGDAGGLLLALLSGSREYIDPKVASGFKNAGLSHILALSGMHLSLFASLALVFGRFVGGKRIGQVCALTCMALFVFFAGDSPSLTRSLICAVLLAAGKMCYLPVSVLPALAASFVLQTFLFPTDAFELSFLLSYAALMGILTIGQVLERLLRPFVPPVLGSPLCASAAACCFTAPVSIGSFSMLAPIGILSSIVVSPIATLFLAVGTISVLCCLVVPVMTIPLGVIMKMLYSCIKIPVLWFSCVPPFTFL